jgi:YVTN family beta-propeller protein
MRMDRIIPLACLFCFLSHNLLCLGQSGTAPIWLPNGRPLSAVPGAPQPTNSLPTTAVVSPDGRYVILLNGGYGTYTSGQRQSLAVFDRHTGSLRDFPDDRLGSDAKQTYFLGLAFNRDGRRLYASMSSLTDPLGKKPGSTGNGIAVYRFEDGKIVPESFLNMPPRQHIPPGDLRRLDMQDVTYPAGLSVGMSDGQERILVANNLSDEAVLLNISNGSVVHRFDLSVFRRVPSAMPYTTVMTSDGKTGYVSLWNASTVAELDLASGRVLRRIPLSRPQSDIEPGSHPTAMLFNKDESLLYVALTNRDEVDVIERQTGKVVSRLSTKLPGQKYGGSDPNALALSPDGKRLFVANATSDSVAVFDVANLLSKTRVEPTGFIPTEWYPTALAVAGDDLFIASGKGRGAGPVTKFEPGSSGRHREYEYVAAMTHGSLARVSLSTLDQHLSAYTEQVMEANRARGNTDQVEFAVRGNPIKHVIYIIKENRTYDQLFGDLGVGNGDPSLAMYGEDITPNQHKLARQFGVLDNFYDSGDVSGDGHVWSTSATVTDYDEKTWPIGYRGHERTYDFEGENLKEIPLNDDDPDAAEPSTGYLWKDLAQHDVTYRHYGEYISSKWCNAPASAGLPTEGTPHPGGEPCARSLIRKGDPLPANVGDPHGSSSPYPWNIPVLARNVPTKPELRGHFDPLFPDFEVSYPDQLRVDEFLNEFSGFVKSRAAGKDTMPQFILLRLPDDHTAGGRRGEPTPSASVADNDLAVGRVAEAISHSAYWNDTAIFILEDDAQDGPDHVDAHRSIALVISKYAPQQGAPFVDHNFYTTVNVVRTMESLLGVPPMNVNDARAAVMSPSFSGRGNQPPFEADRRNRDNGLIYKMNTKPWPEGANLDFSHADAVDTAVLNRYLWKDRMGATPMPKPQHNVFPK